MTAPAPVPASAPLACPRCSVLIQPDGHFCTECGAPVEGAQCAGCGGKLTPGAKFCHRCGTSVGAMPAGVAPATRPQRWQNFAPGVSGARQPPQSAPSTGAPHCAQNRPSTWAEQLGQVAGREGIGGMR